MKNIVLLIMVGLFFYSCAHSLNSNEETASKNDHYTKYREGSRYQR